MTVRLDCNSFNASFIPAENAPPAGGYGGLGLKVPRTHNV